MNQIPFPIASSRCQQSSDIVSGFYFEKWARKITARQVVTWVLLAQQNLDRYCFSISYRERRLRLIYYQLYILKTTWGLIIKKTFDMFLWTIWILFWIFVCVVVTALSCGFLNITRQTNRGILDIKIIFMKQTEHLLCNWESHEWKHPKG